MKTKRQPKRCPGSFFLAGLTALMLFALSPSLKGQETKTNAPPKDAATGSDQAAANKQQAGSTNSPVASAKNTKSAPKQLTGAELYSMHCNRCHPERYPNERTSAQWKTIAMHMRVRANLPAEQYRKLLKYLQDNSGY